MARDDKSFENKDNFGAFDDFMVDYDEEESKDENKEDTVNNSNDYEDKEQDLRDETSRMLESQISMDFDSPRPEEKKVNFDTSSYENAGGEENEESKPQKDDSSDDLKNKLIKYAIWIFVGLVVILLLSAVLSLFSAKPKKQETEKNITLSSGEKYSFANMVGDYQWESSENDVATVTKTGEIEALKEGDTTIVITTDKEKYIYKVHVEGFDDSVTVTKVTMETKTIELAVNDTYEMKVNIYPKNATSSSLSWFSSDNNVAVVDDNGRITAVGKGSCTITVKSSNGNSDLCLVKVTKDGKKSGIVGEIEDISFDTTSLVLKAGIKYTINYSISPTDARGDLDWTSSDERVATIEDGVITTIKEGTISITGKNGYVEDSLTLTVVKGDDNTPDVISDGKTIPVSSISLNQSDMYLYLKSNYTLSVVFNPTNATDKNVIWSSSNTNVVTVDENGNVNAVGLGETTITATAAFNNSATCHIVVVDENWVDPSKESITLSTNSVSVNVGETVQLVETVTPSSNLSKVTWKSSDESIASVSSSGVVTGIKEGSAKITASLPSGLTAECTVNVSKKVINVFQINLNSTSVTLIVGRTSQLSATVAPKNATNKNLTWTSSNNNIVTVDNNGKITGKSTGYATITVRSSNGVKAHCTVIVVEDKKNKAVSGASSLFYGIEDDADKLLVGTYDNTLNVNGRTFKVFKQRYFRDYSYWYNGNIADNGAAPVALATILSGYRTVNPISVANYMGYSSFDRIVETANYYGFGVNNILYYNSLMHNNTKMNDLLLYVKEHLKNGNPIIAYVSGSENLGCDKYKYSGNNHYIAILGLDENNNMIVGNPGLLDGTGSLEELLSCYMPGNDKALILLSPYE